MNLRGSVHAVLDGRIRFGLEAAPPRIGTSIAMLTVRRHCIGLVLDRVVDVVSVPVDRLEPVDGPLTRALGVLALATFDASVVQIVDIDQLLSPSALGVVREALSSISPQAMDDAGAGVDAE